MRRILRMLTGFVVAMLAAALAQVLFAIPPLALAELPREALAAKLETLAILTLAAATHSAIFSGLFVLVAITLAEWLRIRGAFFYGAVGIAIGLAGLLAQFASENAAAPTILNSYAVLTYLAAGLVGGLAYWFIAGRRAGKRRHDPPPRPRLETDAESEPRAAEPVIKAAPMTSVPVTSPKPLQVA